MVLVTRLVSIRRNDDAVSNCDLSPNQSLHGSGPQCLFCFSSLFRPPRDLDVGPINMNINVRPSFIHFFFILISLFVSGCGDDDSPQNSNIHFTNSTDKVITVKYYQEVTDPFTDKTVTKSKTETIPIGENRTLSVQESFWTVSFTIVYNNIEYDEAISVNYVGGDEDYNITLQSLGITSN
jgi:hypothetical protein